MLPIQTPRTLLFLDWVSFSSYHSSLPPIERLGYSGALCAVRPCMANVYTETIPLARHPSNMRT